MASSSSPTNLLPMRSRLKPDSPPSCGKRGREEELSDDDDDRKMSRGSEDSDGSVHACLDAAKKEMTTAERIEYLHQASELFRSKQDLWKPGDMDDEKEMEEMRRKYSRSRIWKTAKEERGAQQQQQACTT